MFANLLNFCLTDDEREDVGVWDVAVILLQLLQAHGHCNHLTFQIGPRLAGHRLAPPELCLLPRDFEFERLVSTFYRVDVFYFDARSALKRDVDICTHRPTSLGPDLSCELEHTYELPQKSSRVLRRMHVRLRHYLDERHSRAVEVHGTYCRIVLPGVLLQVNLADPHPMQLALHRYRQARALVATRQVWIIVVLPLDIRRLTNHNLTTQHQCKFYRRVNRLFVRRERLRTRHPCADRADVRIGGHVLVVGRAIAVHLSLGRELLVNLETDQHIHETASNARMTRSTCSSPSTLPWTCRPTGTPLTFPALMTPPHMPARFAGMVR